MNIVSITPARGGSKGIPGKNMMDFCGRPLVGWTVLQSLSSSLVKKTYVSSDGDEILDYCKSLGCETIRRPDEISGDFATSESAVLHGLDTIEADGTKVDLIVFLQATCPIRRADDIDSAIKLLIDNGADSLFSSCELDSFFLWKLDGENIVSVNYDHNNRQRRQDMPRQFRENGSLFVLKPEILRKKNNRLGGKIITYPMQPWQAYDIDSLDDVEVCEYFFKKYGLDKVF